MSVTPSPIGGFAAQFFDNNGVILSGGKIYTYAAGTTTPQASYTSASGTTPHSNPIILDSAGRVPGGEIWLTDGLVYKFTIETSAGVLIGTYDNVALSLSAAATTFTGFKGQVGSVQDLADNDGSNWIGFLQSGTNAVAISAQDKMRQIISVKDFGAVGDGVTDDTAAIQATIDVVAPSGGQVMLPSGNYKISAALNISSQNVFVQGSGRRATKIIQSIASAKVFNITAPYSAISSLSIEYASQGSAGGAAISLSGAFYSAIDDIYIFRAYIGFDFINSSNSNQLTRVVCEDCTQVGISILDSFNLMASTFQMLNSNTTLCALGCIRIAGNSEGNNFVNGHTYQGAYSLTTGATSYAMGQRPSYNKFHAVYLDASANGAFLDKTVELDFVDCWFSSRPASGATLVQVDGIRFTGGGALNCDQHGVVVEATAKRVVFQNFMARSNSVSSANVYSGIIFRADTTDFVVQGCTATDDIVLFGTQRYGIAVEAGASDRYVITNNLVSGNGTTGVSDGGTGLNKFVANNF